jgi:hypothetical protein
MSWPQWVFSGIGVLALTVIGNVLRRYFKRGQNKEPRLIATADGGSVASAVTASGSGNIQHVNIHHHNEQTTNLLPNSAPPPLVLHAIIVSGRRGDDDGVALEIRWEPGQTTYLHEYTLPPYLTLYTHFRICIVNQSKTQSATNVEVTLEELIPHEMDCVPCHLRLMHNKLVGDKPETPIDKFSLSPGARQFVDVMMQSPSSDSFSIWHTVLHQSVYIPKQAYEMRIVVTADKIQPVSQQFEIFRDGNLWNLRCMGEFPLEIIFDDTNPSRRFWSMESPVDNAGNKLPGAFWEYRVEIKNNSMQTLRNVSVTTERLGQLPQRPFDHMFDKIKEKKCDIKPQTSELVPVLRWPIPIRQSGMLAGPSALLGYGPLKITASADDVLPYIRTFNFDYQVEPMIFD